jgi:hypothetical protein
VSNTTRAIIDDEESELLWQLWHSLRDAHSQNLELVIVDPDVTDFLANTVMAYILAHDHTVHMDTKENE